jgi:hypothetical protein
MTTESGRPNYTHLPNTIEDGKTATHLYLAKTLNDPDSYVAGTWYSSTQMRKGTTTLLHNFRFRNKTGGYSAGRIVSMYDVKKGDWFFLFNPNAHRENDVPQKECWELIESPSIYTLGGNKI